MSTLVIEHVKVSELPESWRARLTATRDARVTVRIEEEVSATVDVGPAFVDGLAELALSAVTYMELVQGCRNRQELERLKQALNRRWATA